MQRPHLAKRCPGLGWPSPVTLNPQPGHSMLQRNCSRSLRTIRCGPPPFFPGGFAGGAGGAGGVGGVGTWSRAAISSLLSLSLGLARPSNKFLLVMFPLVPVPPGSVRVTAVTSVLFAYGGHCRCKRVRQEISGSTLRSTNPWASRWMSFSRTDLGVFVRSPQDLADGDAATLGVGVCVGVGPMGRPPPLGSGQCSWLTRVMRSTSPMFRCTIAPAHWMTGSCRRRLAASLPQPRFQKVDHQMWRATRFYHCTYSPSTPRKTDARFWRYLLPLQRLEECAGLAAAFRRISHRRASRSQTSSRDVSRSYGLPLGHSRREDLYSRSTLSRNTLKLWD